MTKKQVCLINCNFSKLVLATCFGDFQHRAGDFEKTRIGNTDLIDPELGAEESATSFDRKLNNWSKST